MASYDRSAIDAKVAEAKTHTAILAKYWRRS